MVPKTRDALLAAAAQLLDEGGPEAVTLREVGHRSGVSHNAPYKHFADKEALLAAVAARELDRQGSALSATAVGLGPPGAAVQAVMRGYVAWALKFPQRFKLNEIPATVAFHPPVSVFGLEPGRRWVTPTIYDWNLTIERTVTSNSVFRASYHATIGNKLLSRQQSQNQLDPKYWAIYGCWHSPMAPSISPWPATSRPPARDTPPRPNSPTTCSATSVPPPGKRPASAAPSAASCRSSAWPRSPRAPGPRRPARTPGRRPAAGAPPPPRPAPSGPAPPVPPGSRPRRTAR